MKKNVFTFLMTTTLALSLAACGTASPVKEETQTIPPVEDETQAVPAAEGETQAVPVSEDDAQAVPAAEDETHSDESKTAAEAPAAEPENLRQDGDRYEGVIMLEGMEQTVQYEHIVNKTAGFEMDYDYETFVRHSDADRECFILRWDDPENPEYYLEVTYSRDDAEAVAAAVSEDLSKDYEIIRESIALDRAGNCIRIGASEVKGGGYTADRMQMVYIIPADDGCRIATEHYGFDSADLFGARFRAMVNTLSVIDR